MIDLKKRMGEMESCLFLTNDKLGSCEKAVNLIDDVKHHWNKIETGNFELQMHVTGLKSHINEIKENQIDIQDRSMRDNIIFNGMDEVPQEPNESYDEALKNIISDTLKITHHIPFHRVRHMSRKVTGKSRPIFATFFNFKNSEMVRKSAFTTLRGEENRRFSISNQFLKEINE